MDEEDEYETQVETYTTDTGFDFTDLVLNYAVKKVVTAFGHLFSNYKNNSDHTNHCIVKMFHRIAYDCKLPALLFQASIFRVFQNLDKDRKILRNNKSITEMHRFARFILQSFFATAEKNKLVFMELLFWKSAGEAREIVEGYDDSKGKASGRTKASFWSEEDEEKLIRVFHQFKEMQEKENGSGNILDDIETFFDESGKSRRQISKKLKQLGLIKVSFKDKC